jgi:hypothetical protein
MERFGPTEALILSHSAAKRTRHAQARKALALAASLMLGVALLVRFPPEHYGFYPRCPIFEATGLLCPGCGGTRALSALLRGHYLEAVRWNALTVGMVPLALLYAGAMARRVWRGDPGWVRLPAGVWLGLGIVAGIFGVMRNLGGG